MASKPTALDKTLDTPRSRVPIEIDDLLAVTSGVENLDDATDRLLSTEITKARKRATAPTGVDLLEVASASVADDHLATTQQHPVAYGAQSESLALLDQAVPQDFSDPNDIYLDTPKDYSKAPKEAPVPPDIAYERRLTAAGASFEWSELKVHAAGLAALKIPPPHIAALLGIDEDEVIEWHRNTFFQRRVRLLIDNAPRLANDFLQAHLLLGGRKLIAIMNSGSTKAHEIQLRAVKLLFDVTKFDPLKFVKGDPKQESTMANLLKVVEGEARALDDDLDPSYEWAERDVGPELIKATADAQRMMRADDLRLLAPGAPSVEEEFVRAVSRPPETDPAARPPAKAASFLQEHISTLPPLDDTSVDKLLGLAPAPEWDADDAFTLRTEDFLPGAALYDPHAELDLDDLARLRLEESGTDTILNQFLIQSLRGKQWYPIMALDPKKRAQIRSERKKRYLKAREKGLSRPSAPVPTSDLTVVSVS